ncbi:MAG: hypothetical protein A2Z04_05735 [Chloroflexi bacterium RBG_16_57_9]|nr:MAG: hypothetical protein A2Z04_05735 [Chloroflexi bacterium RBG_16_57_9]
MVVWAYPVTVARTPHHLTFSTGEQVYAAEFPERVEALVLVAPADVLAMPQEGGGLFEEIRRRLPESMREEYAAYLKRYLDFQNIEPLEVGSLVKCC